MLQRSNLRSQTRLSSKHRQPLMRYKSKYQMACKSRATCVLIIRTAKAIMINKKTKTIKMTKASREKVHQLSSNNLLMLRRQRRGPVSISLLRIQPRRKLRSRTVSLSQRLKTRSLTILPMCRHKIPRSSRSRSFSQLLIRRFKLHQNRREPLNQRNQFVNRRRQVNLLQFSKCHRNLKKKKSKNHYSPNI